MSYEEPDFKEEIVRGQRLRERARRVLGVGEDAGPEEIKRAYRRFALAYHPDRNADDPRYEEKFIAVAEAYDILVKRTSAPRRYALNKREPYVPTPIDARGYYRWWVAQFGDLF